MYNEFQSLSFRNLIEEISNGNRDLLKFILTDDNYSKFKFWDDIEKEVGVVSIYKFSNIEYLTEHYIPNTLKLDVEDVSNFSKENLELIAEELKEQQLMTFLDDEDFDTSEGITDDVIEYIRDSYLILKILGY